MVLSCGGGRTRTSILRNAPHVTPFHFTARPLRGLLSNLLWLFDCCRFVVVILFRVVSPRDALAASLAARIATWPLMRVSDCCLSASPPWALSCLKLPKNIVASFLRQGSSASSLYRHLGSPFSKKRKLVLFVGQAGLEPASAREDNI